MADELDRKYEVEIKEREGRQKLPDPVKDELKASGMMDEKGKIKTKRSQSKNAQKNETRICRMSSSKRRYSFHTMFCMSKFPKQSNGQSTL